MTRRRISLSFGLTLSILGALLAIPGRAQVMKPKSGDGLAALAFSHEKLRSPEQVVLLGDVHAAADKSLRDGWEAFRLGVGPDAEWQASVDQRTGLVSLAEGGNVPWIPGHGNRMTSEDLAGVLKAKPQAGPVKIDLTILDAIARSFLPRVQEMLGVDPAELVLHRGRSGQPAGHLWFVDYDVVRDGLPIEGARVLFRVNNGNLIQFGSENLPAPGTAVPPTRLTQRQARAALAAYIGGFQPEDAFRDDGSLHLIPVGVPKAKSSEGYEKGHGRALAKVWQLVFQREGVTGTWQARIDATTGEVLELTDVNEYAQVTGGVYATAGPGVSRPMPYTDLSTGGFTNSAGFYNYSLGPVTSSLNGQYAGIVDDFCASPSAPISKGADTLGYISFGSTGGTDCTTPGSGGAGNTPSARTSFYQVNRIKEVARGWLPSATWLSQKLTAKVNETGDACNAFWDGASLNFLQSGSIPSLGEVCANTGEIPATVIHEFGHGLDANDGNSTVYDGATQESYGDTTALLALHDSCLGEGFFISGTCNGYDDGCTTCTGVRDADYAKHNPALPATPDTFIHEYCVNFPNFSSNPGPCGLEPHCESYVPTEAIWDFANRDLPGPGTSSAWATLERLWYSTRGTAGATFTCAPGFIYASDGCGAGSLWKVFRAADDDDGNLSNGTPHSGALFTAFNRHRIACGTDAAFNTSFAGCAPPASPALTSTAGDNSVALSWTASGSAVYDVFRNEIGCNAGFTRIAAATMSTSFTDSAVGDGTTYYYQVVAYPAGNGACASAPSTCVAVTPVAAPCAPPAAPSSLTAIAPASGNIALSWPAVAGANAYSLNRATVSGGPYTQIGLASGTSATDITTVGGTIYFYVVRAIHYANDHTSCTSGSSSQASATAVPDFALSISPAVGTVPTGSTSITYTVSITRQGGFAGPVLLSVSGLPGGTSAMFLSPNPTTGTTAPMRVTVPAFGGFNSLLMVTGTSGALTRRATAQLSR